MSVQSEINRLKNNVSLAYAAIGDMGGTVPTAQVSENLASAISSIPTGVTVRKTTGTFKTASSNNTKVTVNCGFQPDIVLVALNLEDTSSTWGGTTMGNICVVFPEWGAADAYINQCETGYGELYSAIMSRSSTGFTILLRCYDDSWDNVSITNTTFNYIAIKYTA